MLKHIKFSIFLFVPQVLFIILYGFFVDYDVPAAGIPFNSTESEEYYALYPMFQDVHVMIFIGFGFLMTFLKRYSFGSVGFNFLLAAFVIQWAILIRGCLDIHGLADHKINLSLESLLNADFACGAVLISYGAVLGVLSPLQLIVMAFLEIVFYAVNEFIIIEIFKISDIGGSLVIHAFGAYFGLAVSVFHWRKELSGNSKEGSVYHSDFFAMIGTLFLWLFWPSFNGAPAAGTMAGQRAVLTTVFSLAGSGVMAFAVSSLMDKSGKLSMVHVQNATLAGGVAVGSVANLKLGAVGALIVGSIAGILSVVGYAYVTPLLQKFKLHDTCGVNNLHGMPGILAAMVAVILARYTTPSTFSSHELETIYPGLSERGTPYDFTYQAYMQMAGMATTLGVSIVGGLITGFILRAPFLDKTASRALFEDSDYWILDEPEPTGTNGDTPMVVLGDKKEDSVEEKTSGTSTPHEQTALTEVAT